MTIIDKSETSSLSTETDTNLTNIWSHILQEVQNSTKKTPPTKSILLLGDNESGRSTLISRLKGVENISKGIGLEYHYIEIKDEDRDDMPKIGVWIPDGDGACTSLLKFALNETNFENTLVVFVVSMSSPWGIMESLKKWSNILRDHIKKLNIPENKRNEYLKQQCRAFQMYQDPDEKQEILINKKSAPNSSSNTPILGSKLKQFADGSDKKDADNLNNADNADDDDLLLPLDPSILGKNIGLPIIVVVTKSDYISILDKEMEYRIEHFDFIQYHIRKFCLDYGAALFYTTIKDKRTYDKLYKYLIHKLYGYPFNSPSSIVDRESIFIPSGWDNEGKINILLENSTTIKSDSDYSEIISRPTIGKPLLREVETVNATDDQEFLAKLQIQLNKTPIQTVKQEDSIQQTTVTTTPATIKTPHKQPALKGPNPNAPDSTNLKNFFQNLLNKNAPTSAAGGFSNVQSSTAPSHDHTPPGIPNNSTSPPQSGSNSNNTASPNPNESNA